MNQIKKVAKLIKIFCIVLSLVGCSATKGLDCKPGKDAGCRSISDINKMANSKELTEVIKNSDETKADDSKREQKFKFGITKLHGQGLEQKVAVKRVPEETMRIWVNSFTDDKGDFVKETYIHTITKEGYWVER